MLPIKDENPHPPGFKPKLTYALIAVNVIVYFFEVAVTGQFFEFVMADQNGIYPNTIYMYLTWGAVPGCVTGQINAIDLGLGTVVSCPAFSELSLLTSTFMHGGLMHLGGNMLFLWIFGDNIEAKFGRVKYLGIYLLWGIGAGLIHVMGDPGSGIPAVGASGAISGVLGAYLVIFPRARVLTFLMLGFFWRMLHIKAMYFLPFWLIFQNLLPFFIGGFGAAGGGVAYLAHIGGFALGLAVGYIYRKSHGSQFTYGTRYGYRGDYR
jgi:membrane associated rhomboid family serine protease